MPDVNFKAGLKGNAAVEVAPEKARLIKSIWQPHLERLLLDCQNCGGRDWRIVVSPLKNEHDGSAVIQDIACAKCFSRTNVLDGMLPGVRSNPIKGIKQGNGRS